MIEKRQFFGEDGEDSGDGEDSSDFEPSEKLSYCDVVSKPEVVPKPDDNDEDPQATKSKTNENLWTEIQKKILNYLFPRKCWC